MTATLSLPANATGRDFIVGDIHGAFDLLDSALTSVAFDPSKDRVICVGDLINRGSRSRDCLDYLAKPWFFSVRGNHEDIYIKGFRAGFSQDPAKLAKVPAAYAWIFKETPESQKKYCDAFERLPIAIEIDTPDGKIGVVHANVPSNLDWTTFIKNLNAGDADATYTAINCRDRINNNDASGVKGVTRVFLGHTTVARAPRMLGNCCFADTGGVYKAIGENDKDDLFLSIIDIRANADDICTPVKTADDFVRKITPRSPKI